MTIELNTDIQGAGVPRPAAKGNAFGFLNRVILGDCIDAMKSLPNACVDLILTDPPYVTNYRDRQGRSVANDNNSDWILPAFSEAYRLLKPDAFCVSFYGWSKVDRFLRAWRECGFSPVGHFIWVKPYASSVGHSRMCHECAYLLVKGRPAKPANPPVDVLYWKNTGNKLHPTQKPVSSLIPIIEAYSRVGDVVLDPFAGSGSTGVAAYICGRGFILFEKEQPHFDMASRRLSEL